MAARHGTRKTMLELSMEPRTVGIDMIHPVARAALERLSLAEWIESEDDKPIADGARALLSAGGLESVWSRFDEALASCPIRHVRPDLAEELIANILTPLCVYASDGTAVRPNWKVRVRQGKMKANGHLRAAADSLKAAAQHLRDAHDESPFVPGSSIQFLTFVRTALRQEGAAVIADGINPPSYFEGSVSTPKALGILANIILDAAEEDAFEAGPPGLKSQKATWRDWLREAKANLDRMTRSYGADFTLPESGWVALAQALIGDRATRDAVADTLRDV